MKPIEAAAFRNNYFKQVQEKEKGKQPPDLENELTNKLMDTYLRNVDEDIDLRRTLKWKSFKKFARHKKLNEMKKFVEKLLDREKSDIRQKIEAKRQQIIRKLREHQKLIREVKQIQEKNEKDARFLPLLEEAIEKSRILRLVNYKDHISKLLESRMNIHWRKLIKENREGKKRIQTLIKETNYDMVNIEREQTEFQEVVGL
jgi:hypothetical protein